MMLHETGIKAQRDRSLLVTSYRDMAKFFRVPRRDRLTTEQIAKMTNRMLKRACSDLYNSVTVKQARAYGIKIGVIKKPVKKPFILTVRNFLLRPFGEFIKMLYVNKQIHKNIKGLKAVTNA